MAITKKEMLHNEFIELLDDLCTPLKLTLACKNLVLTKEEKEEIKKFRREATAEVKRLFPCD